MTCKKCDHHFCWDCLQPFNINSGEKSNHTDYYKCTNLKPPEDPTLGLAK